MYPNLTEKAPFPGTTCTPSKRAQPRALCSGQCGIITSTVPFMNHVQSLSMITDLVWNIPGAEAGVGVGEGRDWRSTSRAQEEAKASSAVDRGAEKVR